MSTPTHGDVFTCVVNDMMKELHPLAHSSNTIHRLLVNNLDSPVLTAIQHLSLSKLNPSQMDSLLPALGRMTNLTSLALPCCALSPGHLKFLFAETILSKLQSLDLNWAKSVKSQDLLVLAQSTTLTNLTSLNLSGCALLTASTAAAATPPQHSQSPANDLNGLIALFLSPVLKNLTHLNLANNRITDPDAFIALASSPYLSNLVSLNLSGNRIEGAVAALAASSTLANLTDLNLSSTHSGDELISQLCSPPSLIAAKLQSIDLSYNQMTVSSIKMLIQASPHLSKLVIKGNPDLGSAGAALISTSMPNLTKLDLFACNIDNEGCTALTTSTALSNLRELKVGGDSTGAASLISLVNSPTMANLTHLGICDTSGGSEVLIAIAQSAAMANLQQLEFFVNGVDDLGVIALTQSTTLTNLTQLNFGFNDIGPEGLKALCTCPLASKLTYLSLSCNDLGNSLAVDLAASSSTLYNLIELNLEQTTLDDEGIAQLLATPNLDQLNVLWLMGNHAKGSTKAAYAARFDAEI